MYSNIGTNDRIIRIGIGVLLILTGLYSQSGLMILGGAFSLYEGFSSWCVIYQLLGINTCPIKKKNSFQVKYVLKVFFQGVGIFIVAVIMNLFANVVGWLTWYDFLRSPGNILTFDNYVFLFFLYPLSLGVASEIITKRIYSKID